MIIKLKKSDAVELFEAAILRNKPLTLVKDHGVYLMVFGLMDNPDSKSVVKMFDGFDPAGDNEFWYEDSIALFGGGDDFGMDIGDIAWFKLMLGIKNRWSFLRVHVNKNHIKLSVK